MSNSESDLSTPDAYRRYALSLVGVSSSANPSVLFLDTGLPLPEPGGETESGTGACSRPILGCDM